MSLSHKHSNLNDYRQISDTRRILVCNEIVYHSDVAGASLVGAAPTTSSFSTEYLVRNDNRMARLETFTFWDLMRLILETLRYALNQSIGLAMI